MNAAQIKMLGESAQALANSCDAATGEGAVISPDILDSLRRKFNNVKSDGKGLARKRK